MATLTSQQLKDSYQSLVTIGDSITSNPTSGQLENGKGTPLTAVGIGTNTPTDMLNISSDSASNQIGLDTGDQTTYGTLDVGHFTNGAFIGTQAGSNSDSNVLRLGTSGTERMRIKSNGDISFRDGSANEAFYWDASEASLGIGNTSPASFLSGANVAVDVGNSSGGEFIARRTGGEANLAMGVTGGNIGYLYSTTNTPMVFGTNNAEAMRIDSSGNVGIGNDSPSSYGKTTIALGAVGGNVLALQKDSGAGIAFYGASFNNTGLLESQSANGDMVFYTGTSGVSEKFRIYAGGNVGITTGNLILDSGAGIDFSDTPNSSGTMTSELLDDYEEGTWTPAISAGYTSPTYTNTAGVYTKIGNVVNVTLRLQLTGGTADGNQITISGLPFTTKSGSGTESSLSIAFFNGTGYDGTQLLFIASNGTSIFIYDADGTNFTGTEMGDNTWVLHASGFYFT